jgi:hypothetical protein
MGIHAAIGRAGAGIDDNALFTPHTAAALRILPTFRHQMNAPRLRDHSQ